MVDRREDPAGSTAMFRAFVQRREADSSGDRRRVGIAVWAAVAAVVVVVVLVALLT